MPTATPAAAHRPQWIETECLTVAMPADTTFHDDVHFVPIVWEHEGDVAAQRPVIVGAEPHALPFFPRWRLMSLLCADRALRTIGGQLHVGGGHIHPERYLARWREALKNPVTVATLAERRRLGLRVELSAVLDPLRGARSPWAGSPFETFEDLEAAYAGRFVHVAADNGEARFALSLDLSSPKAARHVFHAWSLLSSRADAQARVQVTLVRVNRAVEGQADLLEEVAP